MPPNLMENECRVNQDSHGQWEVPSSPWLNKKKQIAVPCRKISPWLNKEQWAAYSVPSTVINKEQQTAVAPTLEQPGQTWNPLTASKEPGLKKSLLQALKEQQCLKVRRVFISYLLAGPSVPRLLFWLIDWISLNLVRNILSIFSSEIWGIWIGRWPSICLYGWKDLWCKLIDNQSILCGAWYVCPPHKTLAIYLHYYY